MLDLGPLSRVSRQLGSDPAYVQGGGGNTSLKGDGDTMFIKASGISLAAITPETGYVQVDFEKIRAGIGDCRSEAAYGLLLAESIIGDAGGRRPSIETGFHALLGPCVLHSHSVWVNQLTCAEGGREVLLKLFPDALWIPYETPGLDLTLSILERLEGYRAPVVFLQNHGLVVSGPEPDETLALHEAVNARIRSHLGGDLSFPCAATPDLGPDSILFPDQAVYLLNPDLVATDAGRQTIDAYAFLMEAIPRLGMIPRFLSKAHIDVLLGMDSEKYRQKVARG